MSQDMNVYQQSTSSIEHLLRSSSPASGGLYAWGRCGAVATKRCRPYEKLQLPTREKKETAHVEIDFASRRNSHTGRQHFRGLGSALHRGKGTRSHCPLVQPL